MCRITENQVADQKEPKRKYTCLNCREFRTTPIGKRNHITNNPEFRQFPSKKRTSGANGETAIEYFEHQRTWATQEIYMCRITENQAIPKRPMQGKGRREGNKRNTKTTTNLPPRGILYHGRRKSRRRNICRRKTTTPISDASRGN